nr:hypothetical protein [Tanacetum cinerariifolium]
MAALTFVDSHNMVAYLKKSEANFWSTAKTKIVNSETQIRAKVDGKTIVLIESSVRRDLHFDDEDVEGERPGQPTKPQHTPTTALPSHVEPILTVASSSHPKKTHKHRKAKSKVTEIPQSSEPTNLDADEAVVDLCAKKPWGQTDQTRFKKLSKQPNNPPFSRVNTLGSGEDSMKLKELIKLYTKLSARGRNNFDDEGFDAYMNDVFKDVKGDAEQVISAAADEVSTGDAVNINGTQVNTVVHQLLLLIRSEKSKARGVVMKEPSETATRPTVPPQKHDPKDKRKCKMVE